MKKEIIIEGMSCNHCKGRVEKALNGLDGIESAEVILRENKAVITTNQDIHDHVLKEAVEKAGYDVVSIQ